MSNKAVIAEYVNPVVETVKGYPTIRGFWRSDISPEWQYESQIVMKNSERDAWAISQFRQAARRSLARKLEIEESEIEIVLASESCLLPKRFPEVLSALNIKGWLFCNVVTCGCVAVDEVVIAMRRFLAWSGSNIVERRSFSELFPGDTGTYYLHFSLAERLGLVIEGTSSRHPLLTPQGERLLEALSVLDPLEISAATGKSENGYEFNQ